MSPQKEPMRTTIRERFLRAFANLPINAREEIVATLNGEPVSWKAVYLEVIGESERGREILAQIEKLNIL